MDYSHVIQLRETALLKVAYRNEPYLPSIGSFKEAVKPLVLLIEWAMDCMDCRGVYERSASQSLLPGIIVNQIIIALIYLKVGCESA